MLFHGVGWAQDYQMELYSAMLSGRDAASGSKLAI
jgi:hypothetical protein